MSKPMRLSEAIIKGCEGTIQVRSSMWDGRNGCCAIGAACMSTGIPPAEGVGERLTRTFPILNHFTTNPVTGVYDAVAEICVDLNDITRWPRLSIAEWIANVVEPEFYK